MNSKTLRALDDHLDKCFVYSILLNQSHSYYNKLKTLFKIPLILTSSVMSVVNANIGGTNDEALKIVNITFNILTAIILGLTATLKFEEKYQNFISTEKKFLKLYAKIEEKLLHEDEVIQKEFVRDIINEYENIVENLDYDIPSHISKRVRDTYKGKKTLPVFINDCKKEESYRNPVCMNIKTASMDERVLNMKPMSSSIIFEPKRNKPVVLDIKRPNVITEEIEGLQECV